MFVFPSRAVLRTVGVVTGVFAALGAVNLVLIVLAFAVGHGWTAGRTALAVMMWAVWVIGWAALTRRLFVKS